MLHLVRFHCISGEVKVVEGSEFRDIYVIILEWQLAGNHWRWSASPYETTHSLLTTMIMSLQSSFLNFSVGLGAVRLFINVI